MIFIDEVDSLGRQRTEGESASLRRVKTELLTQLDGVSSRNTGVVVIGATNTPWEIDAALRRRFQKRIFTPLPDAKAREHILRLAIGPSEDVPSSVSDRELRRAAAATEGYSSADMNTLSREALMGPIRRCLRSTHFRPSGEGRGVVKLVPCGSRERGARKVDIWSPSFDPDLLQSPPVTAADLQSAIKSVKRSVGRSELERHARFTAQFGNASAARKAQQSQQAASKSVSSSSTGFFGFFSNLHSAIFGVPEAPTTTPSARERSSQAAESSRSFERVAVLN